MHYTICAVSRQISGQIDDYAFGGGAGMVINQSNPIAKCLAG